MSPDPDPIRPESRGPQGALGGLIVKYSGSGLGEEYLASSFLQLTRLSYIYSKFQKTNLKLIGVHNRMMIKT